MNAAPIRIIITDDSAIVRSMMSRLLRYEADIAILSTANDGVAAIEQAKTLHPDIMILDIEMPNMDGLTALPHILKASPHTKVIIASTLTARNADISLKALALGAVDYLQKPTMQHDARLVQFQQQLLYKIRALGVHDAHLPTLPHTPMNLSTISVTPKAVAIAASTGGPLAITKLVKELGGRLAHLPVFITQHMPATFTGVFASNIAEASGVHCKEAEDGEVVKAGTIYIAPGDYHMRVSAHEKSCIIRLGQDAPVNFCRPSADPMILSLTEYYGAELLLVVLTGMGRDGLAGATILHQAGGVILSQDKLSSAVWGMPKAIYEAGIATAIVPLHEMAHHIASLCRLS
jgi:two-component system, chemotaxis family, protein-glutamate methylesterase/glutaminase